MDSSIAFVNEKENHQPMRNNKWRAKCHAMLRCFYCEQSKQYDQMSYADASRNYSFYDIVGRMPTARPCLHCWRETFLLFFPFTQSWSHEWFIKYERLIRAIPEKQFHGFPWFDFEIRNRAASHAKFINFKKIQMFCFESALLRANLSSAKPQNFVGILFFSVVSYFFTWNRINWLLLPT